MSRRIVLLMVALVGLVLAAWFFEVASYRMCGLSPQEDTRTTMWMIKRRMLRFAQEKNRLPSNLAELPIIPGYRNKNTDWWGKLIHFKIDAESIVTLKSDGGRVWTWIPKEGLPLLLQFRAKRETGEWSDEMVHFIEPK